MRTLVVVLVPPSLGVCPSVTVRYGSCVYMDIHFIYVSGRSAGDVVVRLSGRYRRSFVTPRHPGRKNIIRHRDLVGKCMLKLFYCMLSDNVIYVNYVFFSAYFL